MTPTCRRTPVVALLVAALLAVPLQAAGLAPTGELRAIFDEANRVINDPATATQPLDRLSAVLEIVDRVFAFREAAQQALGREWESRTPAEHDEFVQLFSDFLQRTFVLTVASKASLEGGVEIRYRTESIAGDTATVFTTVVARDGTELPVEYQMVRRGDGWAIRDVVWDSVSLVGNYRAQFLRVIRASSYRDLVARMKAKSLEVTTALPFARANGNGRAQTTDMGGLPMPPKPPTLARAPGDPGRGSTPDSFTGSERPPGAPPMIVTADGRAAVRFEPLEEGDERTDTATVAAAATAAPVVQAAATGSARGDSEVRTGPRGGEGSSVPATPPPPPSPAASPLPPAGSAVSAPAVSARGGRQASSAQPARVDVKRAGPPTYWVQVGAFRSAETASEIAEKLLRQQLSVSMEGAEVTSGETIVRLVRVRVGPFADRGAAAVALRDLARKGYTPFLAVE
ncbi:MAG: ABC transporter substrate-binding protein [Candidatus Rokubacteria bacterium]|nr:ABC transporter substrate-binding protein [Candidatus Rokubacteria bacterium]